MFVFVVATLRVRPIRTWLL